MDARPPGPFVVEVLSAEARGTSYNILFHAGTADRLAAKTSVHFVDYLGQRDPAPCKILDVGPTESVCRYTGDGVVTSRVEIDPTVTEEEVPMEVQCAQAWKYHVHCNPPSPPPDAPPGWGGTHNPPHPRSAAIISRELAGSSTIIVVGVGSDVGVAKDWDATLVDEKEEPVRAGEGTIIRIDKARTLVRVELTIDAVARLHVRLMPR